MRRDLHFFIDFSIVKECHKIKDMPLILRRITVRKKWLIKAIMRVTKNKKQLSITLLKIATASRQP